jgi:hypothetical protein
MRVPKQVGDPAKVVRQMTDTTGAGWVTAAAVRFIVCNYCNAVIAGFAGP